MVSDMPAAAALRGLGQALMSGVGEAAVFGGYPARATALAAGFINAGMAHLREIDGAHRAAMLHPGVVAITPVLALSSCGLTHERTARAIVAGYEVALRPGRSPGRAPCGRVSRHRDEGLWQLVDNDAHNPSRCIRPSQCATA
jgi:2-methylcitrate dehydratase PrpD